LKVHHLDCGTMCPCGGLVPKKILPSKIVCHCLLIEANNELILVDTGLGLQDIRDPQRIGIMSNVAGVHIKHTKSAIEHIKNLGFSPRDVTHIIPTHLDFDHAGGIADFPHAKVHVSKHEFNAAFKSNSLRDQQRYKKLQNMKFSEWEIFDSFDGESWFGFETVRDLKGISPEILLIPLFGHSHGQVGVAVYTNGKWLLHCGDAYYERSEITGKGDSSLGWKILQKIVNTDHDLALKNQKRLRELIYKNSHEVEIFCAHDTNEFHELINN
jgi:glyoxylase-like metal-dependent hydrolase (beta-lactamase superfamily II)